MRNNHGGGEYIRVCSECNKYISKINRDGICRDCRKCSDCGVPVTTRSKGRCHKCANKIKISCQKGNKSPFWKGENIGYKQIHIWINKEYGKAFMCQFNPSHVGFFEWANLSGTYKRDRSDWMMSCHSCNIKMDNRKRDEKGRFICD